MHALAAIELPTEKCPIKHAIFLSVPFTYVTERSKLAVTNALGCLVAGVVLSSFSQRFPIHGIEHLMAVRNGLILTIIGVLTVILVSAPTRSLVLSKPALGLGYIMRRAISSRIPVTIFRGSRDEAALAIGFTQSMHAIGEAILDLGSNKNRKKHNIFILIFFLLILILGFSGAYLFLGIAGLFGYYLYCASLGAELFFTFGRYDIESDLTPPWRRCRVESFNSLDLLAIRHSIYDNDKVRAALIEIVNRIGRK
mgnify:CR=1 FL=1